MSGPPRDPHVVVAGGGVAAFESVLALRELLGPYVAIDLVTPAGELEYRPLAVGEPFGLAPARRVRFSDLEQTHGARHVRAKLRHVDVGRRRAETSDGAWLDFDALIVAVGAQPRSWLPGALSFGGAPQVEAYRELLGDVAAGRVQRLVFAAPPQPAWPLPLYELALLTTAWAADRGVIGLELHVVVPEDEPLAVFGPAAARAIRDLLGDRGVRLHEGRAVVRVDADRALLAHGEALACDAVVTLPVLVGRPPEGLPSDRDGFLPVAEDCAVRGAAGVWAVGDATDGPVKHGGFATAQADVAAAAVAAAFGAPVEVPPVSPLLRGVLLTGVVPAYLSAELGTGAGTSTVAFDRPSWPPAKIAGRHLAPYLARGTGLENRAAEDGTDLRALLVTFAKRDAARGHVRSALTWLDAIELLYDELPPELAPLRDPPAGGSKAFSGFGLPSRGPAE